ncbi:lymphocyte antigen 6D [Lampris incognitus]|uniref:lymphocyte antigen 6D n=1 Tax=Lampris incognitus TaxID=2546036 RepID=UPI0024B4DF9A|nr:lymphocyte antigen 6D [Lampris incognitus]
MKILLLAVLVGLLCSTQVHTLRCFTCESDVDCKTAVECPPSANYCKTVVNGDTFSRTCEDTCVEEVDVTCCQEDDC